MKYISYIFSFLIMTTIVFAIFSFTHSHKHYTIEQLLDTKSYGDGTFNFNGEQLLYSKQENGSWNVYSKAIPDGDETMLLPANDRGTFILSGFPNDDRFLFSHESTDGSPHIYMRESEDVTKDLTPYPNAYSLFKGWNQDRTHFFFTSNARDSQNEDLYSMPVDTLKPNLIYENSRSFVISGISNDQHYIALNHILKKGDSHIYLYNAFSGTHTLITPHCTHALYTPIAFSADNQYLYLLTDENHEFVYLKKYSIKNKKFKTIEKYSWDITSVIFSKNDKYRITLINEDSKTVMQIFNQESQEHIQLPKIPEGEISNVQFSEDESSVLFKINNYSSPGDFYIFHLNDQTLQQLTQAMNPKVDVNALAEGEVIHFRSYDDMFIPGIYYEPKSIDANQKMPALIWVHGGPGGQSTKARNYLIQYLVNQGYPVFAINNRGSSGYGKSFYQAADFKHGDADLDDCIWAKKFLISKNYIDENKIGIIGSSYGGYMTLAALAFRPHEMAVGVDICGVSNWVRTLKSIPTHAHIDRELFYNKIGNPYVHVDYLNSISPLKHAKNVIKPLLIFQGAKDPKTQRIESDEMVEAVSKNNIPLHYVVFKSEGHTISKKENMVILAKTTLDFLNQHLSKG